MLHSVERWEPISPFSNESPVSYINLHCLVARRSVPHILEKIATRVEDAPAPWRARRSVEVVDALGTKMSKYSGLPDIVCAA